MAVTHAFASGVECQTENPAGHEPETGQQRINPGLGTTPHANSLTQNDKTGKRENICPSEYQS